MGTVAKVELTYDEGQGANITSEFKDNDGAWEIILASMLVETIAVRHGMTINEVSETIVESIHDSGPSSFNITRELVDKTNTDSNEAN